MLTCSYIANNDFTKAQLKLDTLITDTSNLDFCKLYNSVIQYEQTVAKEFELLTNASLRLPVEDVAIATTGKREVGAAKEVLEIINGITFQETFEIVIPLGNNLRFASEADNSYKEEEVVKVDIFPNPANEQFTLSHNLNIANGNILLVVYNVMGKGVLKKPIPTSTQSISIADLKSGLYFYTITQNGIAVKTDKLVVK